MSRKATRQQSILGLQSLQGGEWVALRDVVASLYGDAPAPWQYAYVARTVSTLERRGLLKGKGGPRNGKYVMVAA